MRPVFHLGEIAAQDWLDLQYVQIMSRDSRCVKVRDMRACLKILAGGADAGYCRKERRHSIPQQFPLLSVDVVPVVGSAWSADPREDCAQPLRMTVRKAAQQERIRNREDCGVRAHSQRQSHDDRQRESRIAQDLPHSKPNIRPEFLHHRQPFLRVILLPHGFCRTEPQSCLPACFSGRHAVPNVLIRLHRNMRVDLFAQTRIAASSRRNVADTCKKPMQRLHVRSSSIYSVLKAFIGSDRAARSAGPSAASSTGINSASTAAPYSRGSFAWTP